MHSRFTLVFVAPIIAVSALLLIVGATTAWYVHTLNRNVSDDLSNHLQSLFATQRLVLVLHDLRADLNRFILTLDRSHFDAAASARREVERSLLEVQGMTTTPDGQEAIAHARAGSGRLFEDLTNIDPEAPSAQIVPQIGALPINEVVISAENLLEISRDVVGTASDRNRVIAERMGLGLMLLGCCGAAAGLLAGFGISRWVSRSIVQLSLSIRDTAGKLDEVVGPVTVAAGAGLDELQAALQTISKKTSAVIDRLQHSQREGLRLEQLAAAGQMAAGLAHELRNPLMSMKILVQAAAERGEAARLRERDLEVLEEEIQRLENLTQMFLDFARGRAPDKQPVAVPYLIEQSIQVVSARAALQGVTIQVDATDPGLIAAVDSGQLRQVLLNLILNALDALPRGGTISVSVLTDLDASGREDLVIRVRDDGPGLPVTLGDRILEPFVSTKETGIGLGLSICKQIAEAHGGQIAARNGDAGGAELTIRVPRVAQTHVSPGMLPPASPTPTHGSKHAYAASC